MQSYYENQQAILKDTFAEISKKIELILTAGQLLVEHGASTAQVIRDMKRAAAFMGIPENKFNLHIMYTTLLLNISDGLQSYTSFRKCLKHGVDMRIISAVSKLTWRALREHYTLEEFEGNLREISTRPRYYVLWQNLLATGATCGAFCVLFGCDFTAAIYTGICAMIGKFVQIKFIHAGINEYVAIAAAAFSATVAAYFAHFLPTETAWHPIIACALFLVPGIPIINGLTDLLNTYLLSGAAQFLKTSMIIAAMTFGIVFALEMLPVVDFTNLHMLPQSDYFSFSLAAAAGAVGFSVLFNLPPRLLIAVGIGGALSVCTRNFLVFELGLTSAIGSLAGATLVSVIAVRAIHWLHTPLQVLIVPAVIPLVPGVLIYRYLFAFIHFKELTLQQILAAIQYGIDAVLIILGIAVGAALPNLFANRAFERKNLEEQERLLSESYQSDI